MKHLLGLLIPITLIANLAAVSEDNIYQIQTTCYHRQGNQLVALESCTVTMQFDHPENGLDWKIITRSGQIHHYRNQGKGIEGWSYLNQKWVKVRETDWFSGKEGILCWDDFCADWRELPLD